MLLFPGLVCICPSSLLCACFICFLLLTATLQGAISHSTHRGLEELEATEQKRRERIATGKDDQGIWSLEWEGGSGGLVGSRPDREIKD